uniref:Uncharacterized protein n=1 Tax=Tanacetum cinerariifolium TaxID=118510 RepID=A0A6L2KVZ2_TANCI|nr:hypothetical protein [Tanacetum cinerariifolium]
MHRIIAWDKVENLNLQSTPQVLPSFEEYTSPVIYLEEVEETLGTPIEPQPQPLTSCPPLDINLGEQRGLEPPIKPPSLDSFRMKEVDHLTNHTPPSPRVASIGLTDISCYYDPCVDDPKKHYGFKPGLLGQSGSLDVDFSNLEMIVNNFLEGLILTIKPKEVENGRINEIRHLKRIIQHPPFQYKALYYHNGVYRYYHLHLNSSVGEPSPLSFK